MCTQMPEEDVGVLLHCLPYPFKTISHCIGASWFGVGQLTSKPQPSFCLCPSSTVLGSQAQAAMPIMLAQKKKKKISYQLSHLPSPMYLVCNPCPNCDVEAVRLMAGPVFLSYKIHGMMQKVG